MESGGSVPNRRDSAERLAMLDQRSDLPVLNTWPGVRVELGRLPPTQNPRGRGTRTPMGNLNPLADFVLVARLDEGRTNGGPVQRGCHGLLADH
jgi:hypothetical protein